MCLDIGVLGAVVVADIGEPFVKPVARSLDLHDQKGVYKVMRGHLYDPLLFIFEVIWGQLYDPLLFIFEVIWGQLYYPLLFIFEVI